MIQKYTFPILWLLIFICALMPVLAWQMSFFTAAILLLLIWALDTILTHNKAQDGMPVTFIRAPKGLLLIGGLFWLNAGVSVLLSEIPWMSFIGFCFFSMLPLSFAMFVLKRDLEAMKTIALGLSGIMVILSLGAIYQLIFMNAEIMGQAHYPMASPGALAAILSLGFFGSLGGLFHAQTPKQKRLAAGLCALILCGLFATGNRGAFLGLTIGFIPLFFWARHVLRQHWLYLSSIFGISLLFLLISYSLIDRLDDHLAVRIGQSLMGATADIGHNRLQIWAGVWEMIKAHPFWGTGIGTFFQYYFEHRQSGELHGTYMAHNDPLQFWVEMGVLAPALFYAFLIGAFMRTRRALTDLAPDHPRRAGIVILASGLGAMVVHAHLTFNFYTLPVLALAGFGLALWYILTAVEEPPQAKTPHHRQSLSCPRWVLNVMSVLVLGGVGIPFSLYMASEHLTTRAEAKLRQGDLQGFHADIEMAKKLSFRQNYKTYLLAVNLPLGLLQGDSGSFTSAQRGAFIQIAKNDALRALALNPRAVSAYHYLAQAGIFEGESPEDRMVLYKKAMAINPFYLTARLELADLYLTSGQAQKSFDLLKAALPYRQSEPRTGELYKKILTQAKALGDKDTQARAQDKMASYLIRQGRKQRER